MDDSFKIPKKRSSKKRSIDDSASGEAGPASSATSGSAGASSKAKKAKKTKKAAATTNKSSASYSGPPSSAADVSKLLHWLSRDRLENLITTSVTNRSALAESDLKNALPPDAKWRFSSASSPGIIKSKKASDDGPVKAGKERVNTGLFDGLDTVIMTSILQHLNVKERYLCCTAVAKSWRGFKTTIPGLFVDLSDESFQRKEVVIGYAGDYTKTENMTAAQVLALLEWVPDLSAVTALRISTRDSCNPNTCKAIIKKLLAAKKKAKKSMDLEKLVLQGPKIYASVLAEAVKGSIGPALTSLALLETKHTKQTKLAEGGVVDLLRTCRNLQELVMPQALVVEHSTLRAHLSALSEARSGATTLLRVLDMNHRGSSTWGADRLRFSEVADIGKFAPELEVLNLAMATGIPASSATESIPTPATFLSKPMTELPRLKEFGVEAIVKRHIWQAAPRYATTSTVNRFLSWLLAGMPQVESFNFGHGETNMSQKEQKVYKFPTLPGIGGGDDDMSLFWPSTLKKLSLDALLLEKDAFKSVHMPALETFLLKGCGPHMGDIVQGMTANHQNLQVGICRITGGTGQTEYHKRNKAIHGVCLTKMELPHLFDPSRRQMVYVALGDEAGDDSELKLEVQR